MKNKNLFKDSNHGTLMTKKVGGLPTLRVKIKQIRKLTMTTS